MHFKLLNCIPFVTVIALLIFISNATRLGVSEIHSEYRLNKVNLISQHYGCSRIFCFFKCFQMFNCLSFATAISNQCFMYNSDMRLSSSDDRSLTLEPTKGFSLFAIQLENGLSCYDISNNSILVADQKCLLGFKVYERSYGRVTPSTKSKVLKDNYLILDFE